MSNDYYNGGTFPATASAATSASMRNELSSITDGFSKLPTITGNAGKALRVNAVASALEAYTATANGLFYANASGQLVNATNLTYDGTTLGLTGSLTLASTSRITGDFSSSSPASRVLVQTTSANNSTQFGLIPSGSATNSQFHVWNAADPTNASLGALIINATSVRVQSSYSGSGTTLPLSFWVGLSEAARFDASTRNFLIAGTTDDGSGNKLQVTGGAGITGNLTLSGGTANGISYLNGSKVVTSGSALTFDGTNLATTGTATAASFIPSSATVPTNGMYLSAANTVAIATNSLKRITIGLGFQVGAPTGGDMGAGTINATGLYVNGTAVGSGTGTVTSVAQSFTGGLISVTGSPVTTTGTLALTVAGTSGGIPYFSSASTWASSGALAANAIVVGGGAGLAPSTVTTGTGVVTAIANAVNTTGGLVTQSGTLAVSSLLLGGGASAAITSTTTGSGVVTALGNAVNATGGFATINGTATLTNKRIDPRVSSTTSAASVTPDISSFDQYCFTALAVGLTINAPTGTPVDGDKLLFRILDNGTSRSLTWNATFTVIGVTLPTATTVNKTTYVGCVYNANNTRWDVVAVSTQA